MCGWIALNVWHSISMTKPVVIIAEELSPATVEALGPDFEIVNVDGTDRPALLKLSLIHI